MLPANDNPSIPGEAAPICAPRKGRLWPPALILALLFAFGLAVFLLLREDASPVTDPDMPWFTVYGGTLYFDESVYSGGSELEVPSSVGGQTVTAIGEFCFSGSDYLTTVILPDTVVEIGELAFADSTAIRGVYIPDGVTWIGDYAFYGCTALESVCVPGSAGYIGSEAFAECPKLMHIFYAGAAEDWIYLYPEAINEGTCIYAYDGTLQLG